VLDPVIAKGLSGLSSGQTRAICDAIQALPHAHCEHLLVNICGVRSSSQTLRLLHLYCVSFRLSTQLSDTHMIGKLDNLYEEL
jgi:hypothetical protein